MDALGWTESWFVQLAGQTFICLALGLWLAARLGRSPARAHAVLVLAMVAALLVPIASWLVKITNGGAFPAAPGANSISLADEISDDGLPRANWISPADEISDDGLPGWTGPVALWMLGSFSLIAGIALSYLRGRRLVADADPVADMRLLSALEAARAAVGLRKKPSLRSHPQVASPMVWALGDRPIALIPDESTNQSNGVDWEAVFIHELSHVQRLDHFAGLVADLTTALLFWNPVIWWARRRLARESEFACDDRIAASGKSPVEFAEALLALRCDALLPRIPATGLTGKRFWLKARVRRLLQVNDKPPAPVSFRWLAGALGATVALVFALAFAQVRQDARPEDSFARPLAAAPDRSIVQAP